MLSKKQLLLVWNSYNVNDVLLPRGLRFSECAIFDDTYEPLGHAAPWYFYNYIFKGNSSRGGYQTAEYSLAVVGDA